MSEISPPAGHALGSPAYRRLQAALVCAGIACFAQLYSPQGILQLISADLDIGAERAALTVSAATGGLALAVMPWSFVGDRIGRRPAMIAAVGSATVLALLAAWSPSVPLLLGLRFLEGAALGGVPALAMAYLSEEVDARARAVAAGWFVAGTTLGGLSGRILATPVADLLGWRAGMTAVVLLAVLAATGFTLLAPRERRFAPRAEARGGRARRLLEPLRDPGQIALLACAFLLMGGFVAIYNYLAFHLSAPPYLLPAALIGLVFLAYLGGTLSSPIAGRLAAAHGRLPVMLGSMALMLLGLLLTLAPPLPVLLLGLVLMTAGFFGAHSVASGWAGARSAGARSQATGLYNLAYYAGSSVLGWALGLVLEDAGWGGVVGAVCAAVLLAALAALALLRAEVR
ncbi:MAG TPA: MFS transporter [Candidatus Brachybacterium intestinipullorum]|uniref:MFS transporter n=1 Tax=Candidatus Brachybacterium intestinipullorum TaxID=2838512 RepID=A0A9D2TGS7_9MICO|nr:MFS transporter [Candidatus Brachybacterium intestinipullorum]